MKEMSKVKISLKKSVQSVMNERRLLSQLNNPYYVFSIYRFIVNMICAFQDKENLYMVLDLMPGGDLRYQLSRRKVFREDETSIFIQILMR